MRSRFALDVIGCVIYATYFIPIGISVENQKMPEDDRKKKSSSIFFLSPPASKVIQEVSKNR